MSVLLDLSFFDHKLEKTAVVWGSLRVAAASRRAMVAERFTVSIGEKGLMVLLIVSSAGFVAPQHVWRAAS